MEQVKSIRKCIIKKHDITDLLYHLGQELTNDKSGKKIFTKSDTTDMSDIFIERVIARRNYNTEQDNNIKHMYDVESQLNQIRCTLSKPLSILKEFFYKVFNYLEKDNDTYLLIMLRYHMLKIVLM